MMIYLLFSFFVLAFTCSYNSDCTSYYGACYTCDSLFTYICIKTAGCCESSSDCNSGEECNGNACESGTMQVTCQTNSDCGNDGECSYGICTTTSSGNTIGSSYSGMGSSSYYFLVGGIPSLGVTGIIITIIFCIRRCNAQRALRTASVVVTTKTAPEPPKNIQFQQQIPQPQVIYMMAPPGMQAPQQMNQNGQVMMGMPMQPQMMMGQNMMPQPQMMGQNMMPQQQMAYNQYGQPMNGQIMMAQPMKQ